MDTRINPKELLDEAIEAVREQEIEKQTINEASARAWDRISRELNFSAETDFKIRGCSDVQGLLPKYKAGRLSEDHALLVRDHLGECMACQTQNSRVADVLAWRAPAAVAKPAVNHMRRYAVAAALLVGAGITSFVFRDAFLPAPAGYRAVVHFVDGPLYVLAKGGQRTLTVGQEVQENEWIRTPRGSHAILKLRDGSLVEMKERSEFGVSMNRNDTTIHLERGNVIVQAAHRRSGHLYVNANDVFVSVTGTVFSVNRGTKGSRVAVIEGEVKVQQGGTQEVLHSGDQIASDRSMTPVSVQDEIAWSTNLDQHLALLKEFSTLRKSLEAVHLPGLRYESRLLKTVPDDTVLFASIPNFGQALGDANRLFQDRIQQSPVLRAWWERNGKSDIDLNQMIEEIRLFSTYLGDEIVLSASLNGAGGIRLAVMSEVKKPGLREFMEAQSAGGVRLHILTAADLGKAAVAGGEVQILLDGNIIAFSPDAELLRTLASQLQNAPSSGNLYLQRVADSYRDGAGLLFTADLERIAALAPQKVLSSTGVNTVKYLILEQREIGGKTENRAVVNFSGTRQGIPSWIAAPAPMGSLSFVSSDATIAASFVVKNPSQLLDDLIRIASANDPNFQRDLANLESKLGIRVREDLAHTLGSDITIALDGPVLPSPSWKIAVEVNDPVRLQQTIERLAAELNVEAKQHNKLGIELEKTQSNDRTIYVVKSLDAPGVEASYAFADGYLVAATSQAVLNRALRTRNNQNSLDRSSRFTSLAPTDGQTNFSAVVYYNLSKFADSVTALTGATNAVTPEQKQAIRELAESTKPALIYAYAKPDQIQIASTGNIMGLGLDNVLTAGGLSGIFQRRLPNMMGKQLRGTPAPGTSYK